MRSECDVHHMSQRLKTALDAFGAIFQFWILIFKCSAITLSVPETNSLVVLSPEETKYKVRTNQQRTNLTTGTSREILTKQSRYLHSHSLVDVVTTIRSARM